MTDYNKESKKDADDNTDQDKIMACYERYLEKGYPHRTAMHLALEEARGKK